MQLNKLMGVIFGMLTIVVTLAIAPQIATANTAVANSGNLTSNMIGMAVVVTFGAPLAILGLLSMAGLFVLGAWQTTTSMREMLNVILTAVIVIVGLTFMLNIVDYAADLIASATGGFDTVLYGLIPLLVYLAVIGLSGWQTFKGVKKLRGGGKEKKKKKAALAGF